MKEVLPVDEHDGTLGRGFSRHARPCAKNNPARGLSACRAGGKSLVSVSRPYNLSPSSAMKSAPANASRRAAPRLLEAEGLGELLLGELAGGAQLVQWEIADDCLGLLGHALP